MDIEDGGRGSRIGHLEKKAGRVRMSESPVIIQALVVISIRSGVDDNAAASGVVLLVIAGVEPLAVSVEYLDHRIDQAVVASLSGDRNLGAGLCGEPIVIGVGIGDVHGV